MAENYKISLGVDLDTSDLKGKIEALDNKHSIKLGVDLKVNDIRDRITAYNKNTNNAKLKLGIKLDTNDLKEQINQLDLGGKGKGKGVAIPVNTTSLEGSLREVRDIITDIKGSLGTLDNGNTKSLVSSVNQIASALERATDESDGLLASLNALSKKDFSFNIGITSKNDPISKNILYGDKVKEIFPQLQQQKNAIIKALQQYYEEIYAAELQAQKSVNKRKLGRKPVSNDPLSVITYATGMDINTAWTLLEKTDAPLKTTGKNKDNYRDRMNEINDFINSMIKGAKAQGINLDPVINEFSMSSDELVKSANDIQTGTKEVQDSFEKLKQVMGGGIDADGLGQVLEPLLDDIKEIRKAFEGLSSIGTIDGLTASFKELSGVLDKLTSNITVVKNTLDNGFSDATIVNSVSDKIEHESDTTTAAVIQNEKKKQEAYKATADAVVYHAGIISKLNKSETNGMNNGDSGTGFYGTGHYFVDSAHKHELDSNNNYNTKPYTSIDLSYYDNLFKATTNEVASELHSFLGNLTKFTHGNDKYGIDELFVQFKNVFGDTIMDAKEFGDRLSQLKSYVEKTKRSENYDRYGDYTDSVSTQFMKSLGYEGVDTRGTEYANTFGGTVIYDLKEESILQANITDELQKQGQMLEKINYAKGQVFDKNEDDKIQSFLDAEYKRREINEIYENSFDLTNLNKANTELTNAETRLKEIDVIINNCQNEIDNAANEAKKFAREMASFGLDMSDEEIQDHMQETIKNHNESIDQLTKEKAELQSKIPVLEEAYNRESQLANEAYEKAKQTVEQRYLEQQQAQESANAVIRNEERKQQAYQETANTINQISGFESAQEELKNLNFNTRSLDSMINDFNNLGIQVKEISHTLNKDGSITFNVSGVDKLGNAVKAIKTLDSSGNFKSFSSSISQSLEDSDRFIKQQKQAVSNLTNQINQLNRAANDQNASRPIKDSAHLDALSSKYNEVTSAIQRMEAASSDTFIDEQNNVKKLISEYKSLVSEYKNAENVSSKMKGTDFYSGLNIAKNDLEKFKAQAKDFPQITDTIKELDKTIEGVGDAASLNNFNDQLRVARSELAKVKSETTAINRNEKVGINVSGLESKIADLQRISPEIDKFETEIDGAKVSVQSLLNDLKQVNTQGDFSVVNSRFKAFTDAAKAAGIAVTEIVERVKSVRDIKLDVELGTYDNQISQMDDKFNRLSSASKELYESVEEVHQAYARMELALENTGDEVADKERLIQAEKEYARAIENANNLLRIQAREEKSDADKLKLIDDRQVFQSKIDAWLTKNSAAAKDFGAAMLDLKAKVENCDRTELNHLEKEFKQLDYAAEKAGKKMMSIGDQIKTKFKEYSAYFSVAEVFMYVEQGLRSMFEQVKLIDSAMTELKKVTDETNESYDRFLTNAASRAKEIGTTIDGLVSSTADFARLGYGFEDAQGLAEVANIYAVVGDEIEGVEGATESLVSTLAAFKSEMNGLSDSEFALSIVDKMNEVSNNFSISSGGIGEALKRSASSMQAANNSLDETIALITAANEVTQDPETVGQAFKTISMRIRGAKTELEDAGESTEGMAESTATLRKEIMALSGVDIMLNEDTFKSTYQIMDELSQKWEGLSDIAQASIIELVAGKHRGNVMASLMSNFDTARSALETSLNSSGSAMAEHAKWSESLEARINSLSASWQALSQTFLQSDFLKGTLDGVIGLIDGVTKLIDTFGTLPTLITAFSTIQSFRGHGFFKVILDEATGTAVDIENVFSKAFSKISLIFSKSSGINFNEEFSNSLNLDVQALRNYEGAILRGMSETEAFDMCLSGASETTKEYIQSGKFATETISEFVNRQKAAQVTLVAQNKTWASAKDIIAEYNSGCINTEMSQKDFISAVNAGNSGLGKYLSGLNGAKGSLGGYVTSLIGAKAATVGLQIATTALNAVIGMGIGALVSIVISGITKWINAEEDLAEKVEEVTSKFKEQHEELQKLKGDYDTTNESSMVSRYDKLSKGVDNLGRNLSLTADEYSEYQSIVNTISDQFPSLINGYDSQGNAILSCKDNVESLVSAYEDLIRAQNNAILTENIKDIGKDFANKVDKNEKQGFWENVGSFFNLDNIGLMDIEMTEASAQYLEQMLNAKNDAELEKIINTMTAFSSFDKNDEGAIMTALEKAGVDTGILGFDLKDALKDTVKNNPQKIKDILESFYDGFEEDISQMKSIAQATLSNAFDLRDSEYYDMSDTMQSIVRNIVNNLDYEFYKQYKDNPLGVQTYINDMLEQLNSLDTTVNKEIETALNLKTQFNNGEVSYGEYVNGVQEAGEIIDSLALDDEIKKDIKLSLGLSEKDGKWFIEEYNALLTRLTSEDYNIQMKTEDAEAFLNALNSNEYAVALDFILSGEADLSNLDIDSLREYIEEQAKIREALNFTIAIDVETESVELLNTAMAESVSGAGLSSESISALKSRYSELASEGYDLSAMFEETSNGIHLNREAVSELEQEYAKQKLSETNDNLKVLKDRYDELTDEINNASDASERASLYREQQSIVQKINDLSTLASQYQGLTSAYNAWLNAEEAGSERDMYENIIEGFETVGDEISRGWIDDGTIKFLELLTGQTDLASKSGRELKELYDSLGNVIGNSGYSISDFFTVDEDGNSTNAGVYNFLETVESFENQLGDVIKRGEDGSIISFDFEVAGGDKAIAEALGISEELVQIMVRAADDAGFVINIDGAYTQLADLKTEAEAARDSLITLKRDGLESLQDVDVVFDLEATGDNLIKEQEKAINLLSKFRKEDGTIDLSITGAQEALDIAEYLTIRIDDLTEPKYMQVDASSLEEELQEPIEKMQEFERLSKEKHLLTLVGDTSKLAETETKMDEIVQYLDDIDDKEVQAKLGITGLTKEEIAEKLEKGEIELDAELNIDVQMSDDLKDMRLMMTNQLGLVSDEEVKLKIGFDIDDSVVDKLTNEQQQVVIEYLANDEDIKDYTPEQKEALVKYIADGGNLDDFTPEEKEAFVNYLVNGGSVEGYTPEDKKAFAKYLVDGGDPDSYQPPSKQQEVKADLDSSEPDNYQPDEKTQPVTAKLNSSAVDNYKPPEKEMTIWAKIRKKASELWDKITGGGGVDGTAHVDGTAFANGTTGRAFKQGNWGTKDSGIALGGEEAPELLVRNGRWHLIGEKGAEFFGYKKGDINK